MTILEQIRSTGIKIATENEIIASKTQEKVSLSQEIITDELSAEDAALEAEMEKGLDEDIENLDSTSTDQ